MSTFTWQTLNSFVSASMVGASARHGGHQVAQKSTRTGPSAWITSHFHLNSLISIWLLPPLTPGSLSTRHFTQVTSNQTLQWLFDDGGHEQGGEVHVMFPEP